MHSGMMLQSNKAARRIGQRKEIIDTYQQREGCQSPRLSSSVLLNLCYLYSV